MLQGRNHPPADLVPGQLCLFLERKGHVLEHTHGVEQGRILEQHAELFPDAVQLRAPQSQYALAVNLDLAAIRLQEPDDVLEQNALAFAAGADDGRDLALGDLKVEAVQDLLGAEGFMYVGQLDHSSIEVRK